MPSATSKTATSPRIMSPAWLAKSQRPHTRVSTVGLDGLLSGFMAGMGESSIGGSDDPYRLSSGANGPNLALSFNPVDSAFAAQGTVHDASNDDSVVKNMLLTFGRNGTTFGQSAYVDDTYYGAMDNESPANSQLVNDSTQPLGQTPGQGAGSYIVSGRANPISGYEHLCRGNRCSDCDFIQWGWWGTRLSTGPENESRQDYVHMGTWVAGEISTMDPADRVPLDVAGYCLLTAPRLLTGTAIGTVAPRRYTARYILRAATSVDGLRLRQSSGCAIQRSAFDGNGAVERVIDDTSTIRQATFGGNLYIRRCSTLSGSVSGAFVKSIGAQRGRRRHRKLQFRRKRA